MMNIYLLVVVHSLAEMFKNGHSQNIDIAMINVSTVQVPAVQTSSYPTAPAQQYFQVPHNTTGSLQQFNHGPEAMETSPPSYSADINKKYESEQSKLYPSTDINTVEKL